MSMSTASKSPELNSGEGLGAVARGLDPEVRLLEEGFAISRVDRFASSTKESGGRKSADAGSSSGASASASRGASQ